MSSIFDDEPPRDLLVVHKQWKLATRQVVPCPGLPAESPSLELFARQHEHLSEYGHIDLWPLMGCLDLALGTRYQAWMITHPKNREVKLLNNIDDCHLCLEDGPYPDRVLDTQLRIQTAAVRRLHDHRTEYLRSRRRLPVLEPKEFVLWAASPQQGYAFHQDVLDWANDEDLNKPTAARLKKAKERKEIYQAIAVEVWRECKADKILNVSEVIRHPIMQAVGRLMGGNGEQTIRRAIKKLHPKYGKLSNNI